jgi:hypothetical protein
VWKRIKKIIYIQSKRSLRIFCINFNESIDEPSPTSTAETMWIMGMSFEDDSLLYIISTGNLPDLYIWNIDAYLGYSFY